MNVFGFQLWYYYFRSRVEVKTVWNVHRHFCFAQYRRGLSVSPGSKNPYYSGYSIKTFWRAPPNNGRYDFADGTSRRSCQNVYKHSSVAAITVLNTGEIRPHLSDIIVRHGRMMTCAPKSQNGLECADILGFRKISTSVVVSVVSSASRVTIIRYVTEFDLTAIKIL